MDGIIPCDSRKISIKSVEEVSTSPECTIGVTDLASPINVTINITNVVIDG